MLTRLTAALKHCRLTWPAVAFLMFVQRSPVLWKAAEFQFSLAPRLVHLFKWIAGAGLTSVFYNTVTGATGDLSIFGNTTAVAETNMQVAVRADKAVPVTVQLVGTLPPGLNSNIGPDGAVPNGTIAFSGVPNTPGDYPVTVTVLTWEKIDDPTNQEERSINVNFEVTLPPPKVTKNPVSVVVPLGGTVQLSVEAAFPEETSYQWQKNVGQSLSQFANIEGATLSVYSVENVTAAMEGAYRVEVTRNGITIISPTNSPNHVFLTVDRTPTFDSWRLQHFDPGDSDGLALGNPDKDSFSNAFEFLFNLDPESPDSIQVPVVTHEKIGAVDYVVFTYPALINYPNLSYTFERTQNLKDGPWTELLHGQNGVIIEVTTTETVLKVPYADQAYFHVKVETN